MRRVSGRFKLATLLQKRMLQLLYGRRAVVETKTKNLAHIVLEEIQQGKIHLDVTGQIREAVNPPAFEAIIRKAIPHGEHVQPGED